MSLGDADLAAGLFFADGVVAVLPDGTTAMVNLNWPEEINSLGGRFPQGMVVGKPSIEYATAALVLKSDMLITVDGTQYKVCHVQKKDDGKVSIAELNKVS